MFPISTGNGCSVCQRAHTKGPFYQTPHKDGTVAKDTGKHSTALPMRMPSQCRCLANREGRVPGAPPPPLQREPSSGPNTPRLSLLMGETRKMKVYDAGLINTVPQVLQPLPNTAGRWPLLPLLPPSSFALAVYVVNPLSRDRRSARLLPQLPHLQTGCWKGQPGELHGVTGHPPATHTHQGV